ncbi:MAG: ribbon-helix-helix domain-containing protein [Micrococcales bacterium]|nr:ribbon-helix-helix domain-containing protein [Micrococcales bacterium]
MRTTLTIDDDVLVAAKEIASSQRRTTGEVISDLVRTALTGQIPSQPAAHDTPDAPDLFGFRPIPPSPGPVVTQDLVNTIREDQGI